MNLNEVVRGVVRVDKPLWGWEEIIVNNGLYCGKRLNIKEGHRLSLQYHKRKHETHYVESGLILFEKGEDGMAGSSSDRIESFVVKEGDVIEIPPCTVHRCGSLRGRSVIVEFSTRHEDSDTYRLEETIKGETNLIPEYLMRQHGQ